jgi:hypothetical protein
MHKRASVESQQPLQSAAILAAAAATAAASTQVLPAHAPVVGPNEVHASAATGNADPSSAAAEDTPMIDCEAAPAAPVPAAESAGLLEPVPKVVPQNAGTV